MNKKLDIVKRCFKHADMLFDIYLENYHSFYIYIRLDYYKKLNIYRLAWIDLGNIDSKDVENIISYEYIPYGVIEQLENIITNIKINKYEKVDKDDCKVTINNNIKDNKFTVIFNRYMPKELNNLFGVIVIIFDNLPRKLNPFLQELSALITGNANKYEYQEEFEFDLFNDDINSIFDSEICIRGEKYYKQNRVFFLEKINDTYYAVVGGKSLYVIIIKYDKGLTKVYCSCPCDFYCKHIYAVMMAIRNNKFRKFYKITHKNNDLDLLDRVMNFNFYLTIGIDDNGINYLVIEDGLLKLLPVLNDKGKSEWVILEDDKNDTLTKKLSEILK